MSDFINKMRIDGIEKMKAIITGSVEETVGLGRLIGENAARGLFVGLSGDLGGGKTTLTRGIARGMGVEGDITSPTFQLLREYAGRERLFHFDFYRLESGADLLDLDIAGCLDSGVVVAEWAERFDVPGADNFILMRLDWEGENRRRIALTGASGAGTALAAIINSKFEYMPE